VKVWIDDAVLVELFANGESRRSGLDLLRPPAFSIGNRSYLFARLDGCLPKRGRFPVLKS